MATILRSKALPTTKALLSIRPLSTFRRFTSAPLRDLATTDRSDDSPSRSLPFFPDALDPFSPSRSLSQVLNLVDQMIESPLGMTGGARKGWDAREDEKGLYLRIDMPGLGKEDVKVTVEQGALVIKGEETEPAVEGGGRRYSSRIGLPEKVYKSGEVKAEMKNGVLKVFVPKVTEEERKDVVQVKID